MKKTFTLGLMATLFVVSSIAFGQTSDDKKDEKKKIKVQLWSGGKPILPNQVLGKNEVEIGVKVFPFDKQELKEKKELVVTDFDILLIRNGRKIAEQTVSGVVGSIANLVEMAKNEDTYAIRIKEIYEITKEGSLRSYAKGMVRMNYLFFDSKLALNSSGQKNSRNR